VVAAENVYADLARQIGGPAVTVTALIDNPAQDPHLFEATPSAARHLSRARIVIYNGAGYDPWMRGLLAATAGSPRTVIQVSALMHTQTGSNPHIWYDPATMPALATTLAAALTQADPANAPGYAARLATVQLWQTQLNHRIAALRARVQGQKIAATEPVFGPMEAALHLDQRDLGFQRAVMNDTEPSASQTEAIEADLRDHQVRALLRNIQTDDDATRRLVRIALQAGTPVVGVSETLPAGQHYQAWVGQQLDDLDRALQ
jgi:zinc/manganese transport system substrate-binding protein